MGLGEGVAIKEGIMKGMGLNKEGAERPAGEKEEEGPTIYS